MNADEVIFMLDRKKIWTASAFEKRAYDFAIEAIEKVERLETENARLKANADKWTDLINKAGAVGLTESDFFKMVETVKGAVKNN